MKRTLRAVEFSLFCPFTSLFTWSSPYISRETLTLSLITPGLTLRGIDNFLEMQPNERIQPDKSVHKPKIFLRISKRIWFNFGRLLPIRQLSIPLNNFLIKTFYRFHRLKYVACK